MLPFRAIALPGESPGSVFLRTFEANGWKPSSLLRAEFTGLVRRSIDPAAMLSGTRTAYKLADQLGLSRGTLQAVLYHETGATGREQYIWNGLVVRYSHLRWQHPAICPECLKSDEVPYARALWDLQLIHSCEAHGRQLLEACPSCGAPLSWDRPRICYCSCGFDLREVTTPAAESLGEHVVVRMALEAKDEKYLERGLFMSKTLMEMHNAGALQISEGQISGVVADILQHPERFHSVLGASVDENGVPPRLALRRLMGDKHQDFAVELLRSLDRAGYRNLPGQWHEVLETPLFTAQAGLLLGTNDRTAGMIFKHHEVGTSGITLATVATFLRAFDPQNVTLSAEYAPPRILRGINILGTEADLKSGRAVSLGYEHAKGLLSAKIAIRMERVAIPLDRMTLAEIADQADVHYESIRFLVHAGFLEAAPPLPGKRMITVYRTAAEHFLEHYRFAGPVAKSIGVNFTDFGDKLRSAGLQPVSGPSIDGGLGYVFKASDIEAADLHAIAAAKNLNARTGRRRKGVFVEEADSVSYADAARALNTSIHKIGALVEAGLLRRAPLNLRIRYVTKQSFQAYSAQFHSDDHVSVQEAAGMFGETTRLFERRWILSELVSVRDLHLVRQVSRAGLEKIRSLKGEYTTRTEVGAELGSYRTHVSDQLKFGRMEAEEVRVGGKHPIWLMRKSSIKVNREPSIQP